jgi:hypothetical protein
MNAALKFGSLCKLGMASVLAIATATPAFAQYQPTPEYQQSLQQYQQDRADYEARREAWETRKEIYDGRRAHYEADRAGYENARAAYERRREDWERARDDYDARYGYGAYVRAYGGEPVWDEDHWAVYPAPAAAHRDRDTAYAAPAETCRNDHSAATAGVIIGALAGAALGSNVAAHGVRTEGAVLGGVVGAAIGGSVGHAHDRYNCDSRGPYYSYDDTIAYREARDYRSGRYDYAYYDRMHCRLAPAPIDTYGRDVRYVRVCPDADGRYRITG